MKNEHPLSSTYKSVYVSCELCTSKILTLGKEDQHELLTQILSQYSGLVNWKPLYQLLIIYILLKLFRENKNKINNYEIEDSFWFYMYTYTRLEYPYQSSNLYKIEIGQTILEININLTICLVDVALDPFVDKVLNTGIKQDLLMVLDNHVPKISLDFAKNSLYLE